MQLRKKNKEEMFKAKRTTLSDKTTASTTAVQGAPLAAAAQQQRLQGFAPTGMSGSNSIPDDQLLDVPIETAL